ncbi:MAG: TonB-dependent receptor [Rhodospirillales bacterium]
MPTIRSRDAHHPVLRTLLLQGTAAAALLVPLGAAGTAMAQDATVLAPISVTATEVAPGGYQIGEEELEQANPIDIKDVFQGEAGVKIGGGGDLARKSYINGLEDSNLNVKIDGARQVGTTFHHMGTVIIDPSLLKSVRVETGVTPADVGPGSLGGSIAYETKDARDILEPGETFGGMAKFHYESDTDLYSPNLTLAGQSSGFETLIHGSYDNANNYHDGRDVEVLGSAPKMKTFLGKAAWTGQGGDRVEFNSSFLQDEGIRPNRVNFAALSNGSQPIPHSYQRKSFGMTYKDEAPTAMINPEFVLSYNEIRLDIDDLALGGNHDVNSKTSSFSGKLANTFTTNLGVAQTGSVTVGVDFYRDKGENSFSSRPGFGPANEPFGNNEISKNIGAFAQARLKMTNDIRVSFGGRFDKQWLFGVNGDHIQTSGASGNLNGEYDFIKGMTGYAGAGSTFGGIPLGESLIYNLTGSWNYIDLEASRSINSKVGFKGEEGPFSADAHIFFTRVIGSHQRGSASRQSNLNLTSKGYNLSGKYTHDNGYLRATFSQQNLRANGEVLATTSSSYHGFNMGSILTLEAAHLFPEYGIRVGTTNEFAFRNADDPANPRNSYLVVNLYAQWQPENIGNMDLGNLTLRLDVKNLFDRTYADRATAGGDSTSASAYFEPGRTFLLTAKMDF